MAVKTRCEAVMFVQNQLVDVTESKREKNGKTHYGIQELRDLIDFLYGGEPKNPNETINSSEHHKWC